MNITVQESLRRGAKLETQGKYAEAIKTYEKALQLEPKNPQINHRLGSLAMVNEEYSKALSFTRVALEKAEPSEMAYWNSYVDNLLALGRLSDTRKANSAG